MENGNSLYIDDERLSGYAAAEARLLNPRPGGNGRREAKALKLSMRRIRELKEAFDEKSASLSYPPAGWNWLRDNYYMLIREYGPVRAALKGSGKMRRCRSELLIFSLCRALLSASQDKISEKRCEIFLKGFQSVIPLSRSELWLFPDAMKALIICRISRLGEDMLTSPGEGSGMEALIKSLRLICLADWDSILYSCSLAAEILSADPTAEYPLMDSGTRQDYLRRVEEEAGKAGMPEQQWASLMLDKARKDGKHIGLYLFPQKKSSGAAFYISLNILLSLFLSLLPAFYLGSAAAALLLLLPISEMVKSLADFILLHLIKPRRMPRMDVSEGVGEEGRSIVIISALLTDAAALKKLCRSLEELYCSCRDKRFISFGLLADFKEADEKELPEDAMLLSLGRRLINGLNRKYGGGFYLFTRERHFDGEKYCGRERKRGALMELAGLIMDEKSELSVCGSRDMLYGTRYMISLDADTGVYPGAIEELISAMLHPLTRPEINEKLRRVERGHGIIQPRISTELESACATDFSLIFAGSGGSDPYGGLCGELYMDAFGSGGFSGKGIIDIAALRYCLAGRLPQGRILSHDALEGAFLRGGFMGDAEFSDSFPSKPLAYYKRLHRWIRGDVQNIPFIFSPALPGIERWRLFDSVRRAFTAPMTLLAVVSGFLSPDKGLILSAWAALLALLSRLIISLAEESLKSREKIPLRRYTRILSGFGGAIVNSFMRLWLLPYEAFVSLSAIISSLWRMGISGKKLLQWQTAAQAEAMSVKLSAHIRAMWFPLLLSSVLLAFSPVIIGKSAALMWLLSPLALWALSLPAYKEEKLRGRDRTFILNSARESFRYFQDFCTEYDNFLPPDNFQEQPPVGLAHRTSPTNIGLALCSFVSAADMGIIERKEAAGMISKTLSSVERLPKYRGQLYNWYDSHSLGILSPPFISSVDSGNFYACLCVLRETMREWGEEELFKRVSSLMAAMDFGFLYDRERRLFYICFDSEKGRGSGGWYDLMASEALLLSYISVAKGDVPIKHWRTLSRGQLQKDGFRGLASWSGTMFEYLMPLIFLPLCRGSLLYESSRFCLYVQRSDVPSGRPWGISESCFYSLDRALNYRYKAHGCAALALKRGQEQELVVSPYSSFLALALAPGAAVRNLQRLAALGAVGSCGFIEALDFTFSRCRRPGGEKVRSYMAHHVGMSICAAANALTDNCLQRRFMAAPENGAMRLLLQERIPSDGLIIKRGRISRPEHSLLRPGLFWEKKGSGGSENYCLLSDGIYNLLCSASGLCSASWGDVRIYGSGKIPFTGSPSLRLSLSGREEELLPGGMDSWSMDEECCSWDTAKGPLSLRHSLFAGGECAGEIRETRLQAEEALSFSLEFNFRPILAAFKDYQNHPAFWSLGLSSELYEGMLLIHRIRRGKNPGLWLCIASDRPAEFGSEKGFVKPYLSNPLISLRTEFSMSAGEELSFRIVLAAGRSRDEVIKAAGQLLKSSERGLIPGAAGVKLGMNESEYQSALGLIPALLTPLSRAGNRKELWQFGVSGDYPYICCDAGAEEAVGLLKSFCLLRSCGMEAELVYLCPDKGEYREPLRQKIEEALRGFDLAELADARGGVHFVPMSGKEIVRRRASFIPGSELRAYAPLTLPVLSAARQDSAVPHWESRDGVFSFNVKDTLPSRVWQHIITNSSFSAIVSDCGMGSMWYENAREMRINEPPEDFRAVSGTEALWIIKGLKSLSLFAANDGCRCRVSFYPGGACWEKEIEGEKIKTSVFIPSGINARVYIIEGGENLELRWALKPSLAADASGLVCGSTDGTVEFENPESYFRGLKFRMYAGSPFTTKLDFSPAAALLSLRAAGKTVLACGVCSAAELKKLCDIKFAEGALHEAERRWHNTLSALNIKSSVPELDNYINSFAPYQALCCRLQARSSLYQSGGAFGFRDQLQDSVNLLLISPEYARRRILDCAAHQYAEGDVMHWWHPHPQGDKGIRSRCSDDLLWLGWALSEYCLKTGDSSLCYEMAPFLISEPLKDSERDRYESPGISEGSDTVLNHVRRALNLCIQRGLGPHALPFFGSGDWNDGLDEVEGESVWLGWFFSLCALNFSKLLSQLGEPDGAYYADLAQRLGKAADRAWSGSFYYRGYLADGSPLGGEDRLDSLPQSFAAFSPFADPRHVRIALRTTLKRLWDKENKLIKLFDPPYSPSEPYVGYISGYGEGFRENGGQYTHAAVWLASALIKRGLKSEGREILLSLLPETHDLSRYEAEPFVLPADIYSAPGHEGEAGWTWYTGSAGWYYKTAAEELLGLSLCGGELKFSPRFLPHEFKYTLSCRDYEGRLHSFSNLSSEAGES